MITLIMFTRRSDIMGEFANSKVVSIVAVAGTVIVLALNLLLIVQTLGSAFRG